MIYHGRRKASCVVNSMLAPLLTEQTRKDLAEKHVFFSVTTYVSNNGTCKVFPIINHSYTAEEEIIHCWLDYFQGTNETTLGIFENVKNMLKSSSWNPDYVQLLTANTVVNSGLCPPVHKSIESRKEKSSLAYCSVHNDKTEKYRLIKSSFDLEKKSLSLILFSHFSPKVSDLKESL